MDRTEGQNHAVMRFRLKGEAIPTSGATYLTILFIYDILFIEQFPTRREEVHRYLITISFTPGRDGSERTTECYEVSMEQPIRSMDQLNAEIRKLCDVKKIAGHVTPIAFSRFSE